MARDGPRTQTEKKQKHPITTTIQDFLTIDFISLPPFLRSMGLKKKISTSRQLSRFRFLPFRVSLVWRTDLKIKLDELVKSRNSIEFVIPAKAGIQLIQDVLDPGFRRGDASRDFLRVHQI
jgi:hypothetical protein